MFALRSDFCHSLSVIDSPYIKCSTGFAMSIGLTGVFSYHSCTPSKESTFLLTDGRICFYILLWRHLSIPFHSFFDICTAVLPMIIVSIQYEVLWILRHTSENHFSHSNLRNVCGLLPIVILKENVMLTILVHLWSLECWWAIVVTLLFGRSWTTVLGHLSRTISHWNTHELHSFLSKQSRSKKFMLTQPLTTCNLSLKKIWN